MSVEQKSDESNETKLIQKRLEYFSHSPDTHWEKIMLNILLKLSRIQDKINKNSKFEDWTTITKEDKKFFGETLSRIDYNNYVEENFGGNENIKRFWDTLKMPGGGRRKYSKKKRRNTRRKSHFRKRRTKKRGRRRKSLKKKRKKKSRRRKSPKKRGYRGKSPKY